MRELDYPETAAHVAEHAAFAAAIGDLVVALETEGPSARLVVRLERDVTRWIHDHVYSTDLALGRFIVARQGSAPPEAPVAEAPGARASVATS